MNVNMDLLSRQNSNILILFGEKERPLRESEVFCLFRNHFYFGVFG